MAVNLAYTLAQMGARVGIFDADVYGPSLPTMVSPALRVLKMDPATRALEPTEYEGVKLVSFGFAGQGSAIMRGPMVSGAPRCAPVWHRARSLTCAAHALLIVSASDVTRLSIISAALCPSGKRCMHSYWVACVTGPVAYASVERPS